VYGQLHEAHTARRGQAALLVALVVSFCLLRLPSLMGMPLFNDEALALLRARDPVNTLGGNFYDGKLLQVFALAALPHLLPDPLVPARLLGVACGLGVVLCLAACGRLVMRPWAGLLAGLLYALAPLAAVQDRLALTDGPLTLISALVLYLSIAYVDGAADRRRDALKLGLLIMIGCLIKLSGVFLLLTPAFAALLLAPAGQRLARLRGLLPAMGLVLALVLPLVLLGYGSAERGKLSTGADWLLVMVAGAQMTGGWLLRYLPGPLLLLPLALLAHARFAARTGARADTQAGTLLRLVGYLLACGLAYQAAFVIVGRTLYPRYFLPAWPALLLAAAVALAELWRTGGAWRATAAATLSLGMLVGLSFNLSYALAPEQAPLAAIDQAQHFERWTAGQNLPTLFADLRTEAATRGGITLVNHTQPRLVNMAAQIYLDDVPELTQHQLNLAAADAPAVLQALARLGPTFVLVDTDVALAYGLEKRFPGLRLWQSYGQPGRPSRFLLFEQP